MTVRHISAGDSIQDFHDIADPDEEIRISPGYDESVETFPIDVRKKQTFRMVGNGVIDIPGNSKGFVLNMNTDPNEYPGAKFINVNVVNGTTAIDVQNARYTGFHDCLFENQSSHAVMVGVNGTTNPISTRFSRCTFEDAGGAGVDAGSNPTHGLMFLSCVMEMNTEKGLDVDAGTNIGLYNCSVQDNGNAGVSIGATERTFMIHKCYFENNVGAQAGEINGG